MSTIAEELVRLEEDALVRVADVEDLAALENLRVELLGKKGSLTGVLRGLGKVDPSERPAIGQAVNVLKERLSGALGDRVASLREKERAARLDVPQLDVTLPAYGPVHGTLHPLSEALRDACEILRSFGFSVAEGPDVEDEVHNFEALNIPADHPARDMQDTFFLKEGGLMRTHTSPVQIRVMETTEPPLRIIAPGSVYRIDDDITHSPMFHQVEGLMVDRGITFGHLKAVLTEFLRKIFDRDLPVRFRPSYFPFTEPSAEVDIGCVLCDATGRSGDSHCRVCGGTAWVEILGSGMVHPAVFEHVGYDPEVYSGFAFGLGIERIAMLKYRIDDIRLFYGGDLRFLSQF